MKLITSPQNEQLKYLAKLLSQSKARREYGQTVLEGVHLLQSCLEAGLQPKQVYLSERAASSDEICALKAKLDGCVTLVSDSALSKITSLSDSGNVMTLIDIPRYGSLLPEGDCVVLDRIQDPGNLGTILRSASASGIGRLVLGEGCADAWSPKVLRAGMGAHFLLEIYERIDLPQWLSVYQGKVWATALSEYENRNLYHLDLKTPCAWVFGNEGSGVGSEVLASADACVKIPMIGRTESLNVAMAATICLFEQMRQRTA